MKLEKIQIFILHVDLGTPGLIKNFFKMLISCQLLWQ